MVPNVADNGQAGGMVTIFRDNSICVTHKSDSILSGSVCLQSYTYRQVSLARLERKWKSNTLHEMINDWQATTNTPSFSLIKFCGTIGNWNANEWRIPRFEYGRMFLTLNVGGFANCSLPDVNIVPQLCWTNQQDEEILTLILQLVGTFIKIMLSIGYHILNHLS